jgi:alcohol dehydrogenase class IV
LLDELTTQGIETLTFPVAGEPTTVTVREAAMYGMKAGCDLVIGFGGGSALDAGKAAAALLTNDGDPEDFLEVIGKGKKLTQPSAPYIAIPTTAGTGSEVTRNAVLESSPTYKKRDAASTRTSFVIRTSVIVVRSDTPYSDSIQRANRIR